LNVPLVENFSRGARVLGMTRTIDVMTVGKTQASFRQRQAPMDKPTWEQDFTERLQNVLSLTPAAVRYPWPSFHPAGYSPDNAIAFLIELHRLYPALKLLPMAAPKFGTGQTVVWHGKCDRVVAVRWTRSTYYYWAYRVEGGFDRNPNACFAERILEPVAKSAYQPGAPRSARLDF
jgi:hypothetical protein